MLKIIAHSRLEVRGPEKQIDLLLPEVNRSLIFENPKYTQAIRMGTRIDPELRSNRNLTFFDFDGEKLILPRGYWHQLERFLKKKKIKYKFIDKTVKRKMVASVDYAEPVKLRPYQLEAVERAVKIESGVIQAPCGAGKTQILAEITRRLGVWTLIIVHTDDLLKQTVERFERAFGTEIGVIKQDRMDLRQITVASVMTLRRRKMTRKFLRKWGCVMLDEAHHAPAESFSTVMQLFPARYRFGATATPYRNDNLHGMMFAVIGLRIFEISYDTLYKGGWLMPAKVKVVYTDFEYRLQRRRGYSQMLSNIVTDKKRNELIIKNLWKCRKRYNLVLSRQIKHLKELHAMFVKAHPELEEQTQLLIGHMSRAQRDSVLESMMEGNINYVFATQLADEGLDVPILDRLHLIFPGRAEGKVQQQIGRIQRTYPGKKKAICYDYVDRKTSVLSRQAEAREEVYRNTGCTISRPKGVKRPMEAWNIV